MDTKTLQQLIIEGIFAKQDEFFRWGFSEKQVQERPQSLYYAPNFRSTLWTLVLLADLKSSAGEPRIESALQLITEHFYDAECGIFRLPNGSHFPIPCLSGNMIYLHQYFKLPLSKELKTTINFFAEWQRFDDGDFKTPKTYPYCSNTSCYGRHTCFWGVTKLLKGISFIPKRKRTAKAQRLIDKCIDFVLHHEVCFSSKNCKKLLHRDIGLLSFPNFYKSDFLELLWLLAREGVQDKRMDRALELLRMKRKENGYKLEKAVNTVVSIGAKGCFNPFITERANEVLSYYGD